jgi:hypothetical protein
MKRSDRIRRNLKRSDSTLHKEQGGVSPELNKSERAEVGRERKAQREADNKSALSKPSELTPLQKKRLERSEAIKQARKLKRENKPKNN